MRTIVQYLIQQGLQTQYADMGLVLDDLSSGYGVEVNDTYVRLENIVQASQWIANFAETGEIENIEIFNPETNQTESKSLEVSEKESAKVSDDFYDVEASETIEDAIMGEPIKETSSTIMQPLEIKFSELKEAVKFFNAFKTKQQNSVEISKEGFKYSSAFYQLELPIEQIIYVNLEHLKAFTTMYSGREFSKITLDFENSKIVSENLSLELGIADSFDVPDTSEFTEIVTEDSEVLKTLLVAAGKDKRQTELQVINLKVFGDDLVDFAATNGVQLYLKMNPHSIEEFVDIQVKAETIKKFLNFGNASVTFRLFENSLELSSGKCKLITEVADAEFLDYSPLIDTFSNEKINAWSLKALSNISKLIKKIPNKKDSEIKFINQGNAVEFAITLLDSVIASGNLAQLDSNAWEDFSVGTECFYNLLTVSKRYKSLYFEQAEESIQFSHTKEQELIFIMHSEKI